MNRHDMRRPRLSMAYMSSHAVSPTPTPTPRENRERPFSSLHSKRLRNLRRRAMSGQFAAGIIMYYASIAASSAVLTKTSS
jgi:hypothetical protein